MIEQDRPEERQIRTARGSAPTANALTPWPDVVLSEQRGEADAEERHDETGRDLVGTAGQHHERVDEGERGAGQGAGEGAEPHAARLDADDVRGERAGEHRSLGTEVDDAGSLRERLADDRIQDRRAAGDGAGQDLLEHQASFFWAKPRTARSTSAMRTFTAAPDSPAVIFRPKPPTAIAARANDDTIALNGWCLASHEARKAM